MANHAGADAAHVFDQIASDAFFRKPALEFAAAHERAGGRRTSTSSLWETAVSGLGACHALELSFVFDALRDTNSFTGPNLPQQVADDMHSAWIAFATTGGSGWPSYGFGETVRVRLPQSTTSTLPGRPISPRGVVPDRSRGRHRVVTSSAAFGRRRRLPMAGRK